MDAQRRRQFELLDVARAATIEWAEREAINLRCIHFVVPFVATDFSACVWMFFDTDHRVSQYSADGTTELVEATFAAALEGGNYPEAWRCLLSFCVDSHENVEANFQGSYFYRLR